MCKALQERSFEYASDSLIPENDSKENSRFLVKNLEIFAFSYFIPFPLASI